jgi:hypothetical protein
MIKAQYNGQCTNDKRQHAASSTSAAILMQIKLLTVREIRYLARNIRRALLRGDFHQFFYSIACNFLLLRIIASISVVSPLRKTEVNWKISEKRWAKSAKRFYLFAKSRRQECFQKANSSILIQSTRREQFSCSTLRSMRNASGNTSGKALNRSFALLFSYAAIEDENGKTGRKRLGVERARDRLELV